MPLGENRNSLNNSKLSLFFIGASLFTPKQGLVKYTTTIDPDFFFIDIASSNSRESFAVHVGNQIFQGYRT